MIGRIKPTDVIIETEDGPKTYSISKIPAVPAREIMAKYPLSAMPKLGDYKVNEETMHKLMSYVCAYSADGNLIALTNAGLIHNHIDSWETLAKIEIAMISYNCSFFRNGKISSLLADFAQNTLPLAAKTLTDYLSRSSKTNKQPGES